MKFLLWWAHERHDVIDTKKSAVYFFNKFIQINEIHLYRSPNIQKRKKSNKSKPELSKYEGKNSKKTILILTQE